MTKETNTPTEEIAATRVVLERLEERLSDALDATINLRLKNYRKILLALGLALLIAFGGIYYSYILSAEVDDSRLDAARASCERSNEVREGIISAFDGVVEALLTGLGVNDNDPVVVTFKENVDKSLIPLKARDCSEI